MEILDFISDDGLRASLASDYDEMEICLGTQAYKSVYVLSGSIIEAVFVDNLLTVQPGIGRDRILAMDLSGLIDLCHERKMISSKSKDLLTVLRTYRNLIHPGREIRLSERANAKEAKIARELVDIVLEEITRSKREKYGYTAEQITAKILADSSSDAIVEHLLVGMNENEIRRLLIDKLPTAYYEKKEEEGSIEFFTAEMKAIGKCFAKILAKASYELQTQTMKQHVRILKEESSFRIACYDEAFATCMYLDHLDYQEKELVIDHLLLLFDGWMSVRSFSAMNDIGRHLVADKAVTFALKLLSLMLRTEDEDLVSTSHDTLFAEYSNMLESEQKVVIDRFRKRSKDLASRGLTSQADEVDKISEALFASNIPF